jgi:hypothetical protein
MYQGVFTFGLATNLKFRLARPLNRNYGCGHARFGTAAGSKRHPVFPFTAPHIAHPCAGSAYYQLPT